MNHPADHDRLLQGYLDGTLAEPQRHAFEQQLESDAALAQQLRVQRDIDARLRRIFSVDNVRIELPAAMNGEPLEVAGSTNGVAQAARSAVAGRILTGGNMSVGEASRKLVRHWRVAAGIALAAGLGWLGWIGWQASPWYPTPAERMFAATVESGFKPVWICKDEAEFTTFVREKQHQPLHLPISRLPAGVQVTGVAYSDLLSGYTMLVLAKIDGREAIVVIDNIARDKPLSVRESSELTIHRRQIGKLVLYELTPERDARLLELFSAEPSLATSSL